MVSQLENVIQAPKNETATVAQVPAENNEDIKTKTPPPKADFGKVEHLGTQEGEGSKPPENRFTEFATTGHAYPEAYFFNSMPDIQQGNVLIAISCNKKAAEIIKGDVAKRIMTRAAELTSGHLGLFIADEIMKYNEIASNKSPRKAYKTAMKYGDHFYAIFAEAIGRMDEAIRKRTSIYRWADIATQALSSEVEKIKAIYRTNPKFEELLIKAATQLLEWRCPEFTPTQKRIDAILEFIFHEVPVVGSWRLPTIAGIPFHGMIYPAIHPRGMQVIAGIVSEFDNILGEGKRTLLVMHLIQGA